MTAAQIARATLSADGTTIQCQFNPETVTRVKTANWTTHPATASGSQPKQQFSGTGTEQLTAKLLFDRHERLGDAAAMDVHEAITIMMAWLTVPTSAQAKNTPQPPMVRFAWGRGIHFTGVLSQLQVQYLMFNAEGRVQRAYASITIKAMPDDPPSTNPTSGGVIGRAAAQVREGDTLPSLAYQQYGDPNLWRAIAIANNIDDPTRLPPGLRLVLPPRSDAVAYSDRGVDHA